MTIRRREVANFGSPMQHVELGAGGRAETVA